MNRANFVLQEYTFIYFLWNVFLVKIEFEVALLYFDSFYFKMEKLNCFITLIALSFIIYFNKYLSLFNIKYIFCPKLSKSDQNLGSDHFRISVYDFWFKFFKFLSRLDCSFDFLENRILNHFYLVKVSLLYGFWIIN